MVERLRRHVDKEKNVFRQLQCPLKDRSAADRVQLGSPAEAFSDLKRLCRTRKLVVGSRAAQGLKAEHRATLQVEDGLKRNVQLPFADEQANRAYFGRRDYRDRTLDLVKTNDHISAPQTRLSKRRFRLPQK